MKTTTAPSPVQTHQFGRMGERLAVWYLKLSGYRIVKRNYRNRLGEIDIIAREDETLVFVEVKARRTRRYGHPKYAVTRQKQRTLSKVALAYLKETGKMRDKARFDVISICGYSSPPAVELIRNAFELVVD
jgi:putative endonuclease